MPGSPRLPQRPGGSTAGGPGCPAPRGGTWPTWSGTGARCSTSGAGWCARGPRPRPAYPEPTRPDDEALLEWAAERSHELEDALTRADPTDPVWTWAPQQDVAFVLRRQAQEATVHRVDAEQVLGRVTGIPA
jgi:hypothetical protein